MRTLCRSWRWHGPAWLGPALALALLTLAAAPPAHAQEEALGVLSGRVADEQGRPVAGAEVAIPALRRKTVTRSDGEYLLERVPAGTHTVWVSNLGFRVQTAEVEVTQSAYRGVLRGDRMVPGDRTMQSFTLAADPLALEAIVVTGMAAPRTKLESSVAITALPPQVVEQANPRSTTEILRYVPGFTRVESSGGEVNQNIQMRGILGVEYVMFMEDGLPVFPTMHTFFMNADNLFRPDENLARVEVVRGGTSALFGSNTPGAIVNFINKEGGAALRGSMKATAGTEGLARYDLNVNGPLGEDWRFNAGGFYRYDHGVRDPGFPGIRGGQVKASLTRLLESGSLRLSLKAIDDRNQFILPLPFRDPDDPEYVPGFGDYGSMNTREGLDLTVPTPDGTLQLPLGDGLRTRAFWLTSNADFDLADGWTLTNAAQVMENEQGWNAIVPFDVMPAADWVRSLGLPAGSSYRLWYTNLRDQRGNPLPFDAGSNDGLGLVAPSGQWHVEKPLTAFQDQLQVKRTLGEHTLAAGVYFAHYTQQNRWYFTDILLDVRDNPHFLDLSVTRGGETTAYTRNGFRNFLSLYRNGSGQATIFSGMLGGAFELSDRLHADVGVRVERNNFVMSAENTSRVDLDGAAATRFDNVEWGSGSFRHLERTLDDWAASLGLNYRVNERFSLYGATSRAYKMPALDEFLNAESQARVDRFEPSENLTAEAGVKFASGPYALTVNGFFTDLRNIIGQGAVTNPATGAITWITQENPSLRSYGVEVEGSASPLPGLTLLGTGTALKAEYSKCPAGSSAVGCPAGADVGTFLNGVPPVIGNLAATYDLRGVRLLADWHFVARRYSAFEVDGKRNELPTYHYSNLGASYELPGRAVSVNVDLLNVYQSKGLEEGNPRLTLSGGRTSDLFLARPLLPRRMLVALRYHF